MNLSFNFLQDFYVIGEEKTSCIPSKYLYKFLPKGLLTVISLKGLTLIKIQ